VTIAEHLAASLENEPLVEGFHESGIDDRGGNADSSELISRALGGEDHGAESEDSHVGP
jgi:hypothetical protein